MRASGRGLHRRVHLAILCGLAVAVGPLSAQSKSSQVLILPNPTPREPDLETRFNTSSTPAGPNSAALLAAYNRRRFLLIKQASTHLHSLATVLQASVARDQSAAILPQQAKLAGAMETLAGNVYAALATASPQPPAKKDATQPAAPASPAERAQINTDTQQLVTLTKALQTEVSKSSADALPVGVLLKSAEVKQLAHSLKQRLQPEQTQHP